MKTNTQLQVDVMEELQYEPILDAAGIGITAGTASSPFPARSELRRRSGPPHMPQNESVESRPS